MELKEVFGLAIGNARKSRMRSILTLLSVAIGVASVLIITSLGEGGQSSINKELSKLGINGITVFANSAVSQNARQALSQQDVEYLKNRVVGVENAMGIVNKYGSYKLKSTNGNILLWGVDNNISQVINISLLYGRPINAQDVTSARQVCLIDQALAKQVYKRDNIVGKKISLTVESQTNEFEIIGVIRSQKDGINSMIGGVIPEFAYIPHTVLSKMLGTTSFDQIAIKCADTADSDKVGSLSAQVLSRKYNKSDGFLAENMTGYIENFRAITGLITLILSGVAAISLCVAGLGIMNSMLSSTAERKREIGVCMALGARRHDIGAIFLAESALISFAGGLVGVLCGIGISAMILSSFGMTPVVQLDHILTVLGVAAACGIAFGVIPAVRASKLDPIVALRDM